MGDKKVLFLTTAIPLNKPVIRDRSYFRVKIFNAILNHDLRGAITYLRHALNTLDLSEAERANELDQFVHVMDEQMRLFHQRLVYLHLETYQQAVDMARRNPRCNGYRTTTARVTQDNFAKALDFSYQAGACRAKLLQLYAYGCVTDEALLEIEECLPEM